MRSGETPDHFERCESNYKPLHSFSLPKDRQYQQQFADIYFLRLTKIKPAVEEAATAAWEGMILGGETATKVDRVLDVRQGQLCWVAGTVYMDMPLKPNVLEDVSKDVSGLAAKREIAKSQERPTDLRSAGFRPRRLSTTTLPRMAGSRSCWRTTLAASAWSGTP